MNRWLLCGLVFACCLASEVAAQAPNYNPANPREYTLGLRPMVVPPTPAVSNREMLIVVAVVLTVVALMLWWRKYWM
jgi:hypothetical protein